MQHTDCILSQRLRPKKTASFCVIDVFLELLLYVGLNEPPKSLHTSGVAASFHRQYTIPAIKPTTKDTRLTAYFPGQLG